MCLRCRRCSRRDAHCLSSFTVAFLSLSTSTALRRAASVEGVRRRSSDGLSLIRTLPPSSPSFAPRGGVPHGVKLVGRHLRRVDEIHTCTAFGHGAGAARRFSRCRGRRPPGFVTDAYRSHQWAGVRSVYTEADEAVSPGSLLGLLESAPLLSLRKGARPSKVSILQAAFGGHRCPFRTRRPDRSWCPRLSISDGPVWGREFLVTSPSAPKHGILSVRGDRSALRRLSQYGLDGDGSGTFALHEGHRRRAP